jgi:hypothetical protein
MDARAKWLKKLAREAQRQKLARLRADVREASQQRRTARGRARRACSGARVRARAWIADARAQLRKQIDKMRGELRSRIDARRAAVKACCTDDRKAVRAQADAHVKAAREALEALRNEHKRERTWTRPDTKQAPTPRKVAKAESDHAVEVNLGPDELIVWHRVKSKIHATPRMSRTEAFAHWMHDHSGEVARLLEEDADRGYREALKREKRERAEMKQAMRSPVKMRDLVHAELDAVPF